MANLLQNIAGMGDMTEQVIVTDFLISVKTAIRNYAAAIGETVTPEVKSVLMRHLDTAIDTHEKVTNYMIKKGYYHTHDYSSQLKVDMKATDTVMSLNK